MSTATIVERYTEKGGIEYTNMIHILQTKRPIMGFSVQNFLNILLGEWRNTLEKE